MSPPPNIPTTPRPPKPPPGPPAKVKGRIDAAKAKRPDLFAYIRRHPDYPGLVDAVLCKGCRAPIRTWIDDDRFDEVRTIAGQRTVFRRVVFATLPNYVEVLLAFDDGSAHASPMCRQCAERLTAADLEDLYAADLAEMDEIEKGGGGRPPWESMADRLPVRVDAIAQPGTEA